MTDESRHGLQIPRPLAGVFLLVGPVIFRGVDGVAAEDPVAGFADHGDGGDGDQDQDRGVGVGSSGAEVVQAAAVAQGEFAELVDDVVTDAEVRGGLAGGMGFGSSEVGLFGGDLAGVGAVASLGVVDDAEGVEQGLEISDGGRPGPGAEPGSRAGASTSDEPGPSPGLHSTGLTLRRG